MWCRCRGPGGWSRGDGGSSSTTRLSGEEECGRILPGGAGAMQAEEYNTPAGECKTEEEVIDLT